MSVRTEPLRLLLVEDSEDDEALVLRELKRSGFDVTMRRVQTVPTLEAALLETWDLILCDYTMPHLDAPTALKIVRTNFVDLPFIVISGTVGEDTAVEVMRAGAHDYLLKGNLTRLGPAITRELRDARARAERRRTELAQKQAEASFRLIIESSPDLIVVHREGRILYANPKTCERLGCLDPTALVTTPLATIVIAPDGRSQRAPTETESGRPAPVEQRWKRRDGSVISVEVVNNDVVFEGEPATVVIARDLTERNQIAAAMIEMDRMAAIGILAAGVGHEINNPLAYVLANLEFVTSELDVIVAELPAEAHKRLEARILDLSQALADTNHGAQRVRAIVADLRTFSRGDDETVSLVDPRQILESSVRMAAVQIRQRATIVKDYAADLPPVLANESRLGQVFLNLVVNAAQALPEGSPATNRIEMVAREEGGFVRIEIADTGSGIPADTLPRIFDPFFTTKPVGQGTGLGLSICRRIIAQLGGDITVTSQVGVGTRFIVRIPRAGSSDRPPAESVVSRAISGKRATILCIDDEHALGLALKRVLAGQHDVVVMTNAAEALARVKSGDRFDLVLCDLMMPRMTGMDLHAELMLVAPVLASRMLFLTGGAFTPRAREFLESVPNRRLEKPVGLVALRAAIEDLLVSG